MSLHVNVTSREKTVVIVLEGDLDAAGAPLLQGNLEIAAAQNPERLVLDMRGLDYLSSAGLRQLVYAQQKLADDVHIVLVGANERVAATIRLVGFDQSVRFADEIPE